MSNPYTSQSISGYNSSPPSDDGSQNSTNEITWAKHKTKLADPVKTLSEAINTELLSAFASLFGGNISTHSTAYTVVAGDRGKFLSVTGTTTITLLDISTAGTGFPIAIVNTGAGTVTVDGDSAETINGAATVSLGPGACVILTTDGTTGWVGSVSTGKGETGSGSGFDADTVDGNEGSALLDRSNHTGTQTLATISDSGALAALDTVSQSEIDASAIGQGELKSTTATQTTNIASLTYNEIALTGGTYTMFWTAGSVDSRNPNDISGGIHGPIHNDGTYATKIGFHNSDGTPADVYVYSRYVQASPPWVHGSTEVPIYIMAMLNKNTQEVLGTYAAQDPPWAYHGHHNLHPVDGRLEKAFGLWGKSITAMRQDPEFIEKMREMKRLKSQGGKELSDVLNQNTFSMEEKMIDMDIVPHLFRNYDPAKHVVVMLDPSCSCTEEHALLQEFCEDMGDEHISKMLHSGRIKFDNSPIDIPGPMEVLCCKYEVK